MHLPHKQSDAITDCATRLHEVTSELLSAVSPSDRPQTFAASQDLLTEQPKELVWRVESGEVFYRVGAKQVTCHSPGDLLNLEPNQFERRGAYGCAETVTMTPFRRQDLLSSAPRELTEYLLLSSSFHRSALAQEIRADFQPAAGFVHFPAGETIIHQGAEAGRVYTLLEGEAEAVRDGVKVGEIHANEIFGALAVFTRQKRIASVLAKSDCTVLAVRKEEFADLAELQPQICLGLIEELSDKIHHLNTQVLSMQAKG